MATCYECGREIPKGDVQRRSVLTGREVFRGRRVSTRTSHGLRTLCEDCARKHDSRSCGNSIGGLGVILVIAYLGLRSCSGNADTIPVAASGTTAQSETSEQVRVRAQNMMPAQINRTLPHPKKVYCTSVTLQEDKPFHYFGTAYYNINRTRHVEVSAVDGKWQWRVY